MLKNKFVSCLSSCFDTVENEWAVWIWNMMKYDLDIHIFGNCDEDMENRVSASVGRGIDSAGLHRGQLRSELRSETRSLPCRVFHRGCPEIDVFCWKICPPSRQGCNEGVLHWNAAWPLPRWLNTAATRIIERIVWRRSLIRTAHWLEHGNLLFMFFRIIEP